MNLAPSGVTYPSRSNQTRHDDAVRNGERQRIRRELHDSTSQLLVALQLNLGCLKAASQTAETRQLFCALDQTLQELHSAVRAVSSCDEALSLQEPLPLALEAMTTHFAILTNITATLKVKGSCVSRTADVEMSLYRIAQEALANVARHAHATEVRLQLDYTKTGTLKLTIDDDGVGFRTCTEVDLPENGTGMGNIRQRVHEMDGHLQLSRLRHGSRLAVTIGASLRVVA